MIICIYVVISKKRVWAIIMSASNKKNRDLPILTLMRHGQSEWNKRNLFTGWVDIPLSREGIEEALAGGKKMADVPVDVIFTSALIRAQMTAMLAMSEHASNKVPCIVSGGIGTQEGCIPVYISSALNERMYGQLQGLNKQAMREKFGEEQVQIWRRSYRGTPPGGESLEMTTARALPYFKETIVPHLKSGKNVLISAHGNSLRAIVMYLEGLSEMEVVNLEIPTGKPMYYRFNDGKWTKTASS